MSDIIAIMYNKNTLEVVGHAPVNDRFEITQTEVKSDAITMTGIDWTIIAVGYYQYMDIPKKFDGENEVPWLLSELDLKPITADDLPRSQHIAKLKAVNPSVARPATVTRRFMGENYDVDCFVTQGVKDEYTAGDIAIGDYVVVSFISEYPDGEEKDIAIVTGKVFRSW